MPGPSRPPYPPEFRAEAVKRYRGTGRSLNAVSQELGIALETLRDWVRKAEIEEGLRPGLGEEERTELTRLRRENRMLREEREILKKAAAFFARESESR